MEEQNENIEIVKDELLDIFTAEEDKMGTDLLEMSDFYTTFVDKIKIGLEKDSPWVTIDNIESFLGEISAALKSGFDITQMGTLIADYSHFNQDIIDGLKDGTYHIGQSREVAGNLRPAILDKDEQLVKFFTLKKAVNPTSVLADISNLSMQLMLQEMNSKIENLGKDIKYVINFTRKKDLHGPFINAREEILKASKANKTKKRNHLETADKYLYNGLNLLYADINIQIEALSKENGPFVKLNTIDTLLFYINEDLLLVPRYVGLRAYLFNYLGEQDSVNQVFDSYRYFLKSLNEKKFGGGKYTAFELIHKYYPYSKENIDFWLEKPQLMLDSIDAYTEKIEENNKSIYFIKSEEDTLSET